MSRKDRSRSPSSADSLQISKTIAGFGRYPQKRPRGLPVDTLGCVKLDDIMRCWGFAQGLEEKDIMHAVRQHMFRETAGGGSLRFAMDGDADGGIVIRVMPTDRDVDRGGRPHRSRGLRDMPYEGVLGRAFGMRPPEQRVPKMIGSVLRTPLPKPMPTSPNVNGALSRAKQKGNKLDMSLDDVIRSEEVIDLEADDRVNPFSRKREQVLNKVRQMGLHPDTMHLRRAPQDTDFFPKGGRRGEGRNHRRRWSPQEKVQRWVSWVVQAGYQELGIMLAEGGWVDIAALAAAIPKSRPDFGDFDAEKLKVFIQDSDVDGRFEINPANQLRKVPKDRRKAKDQRSPFERKVELQAPRDPLGMIEVESSASSGRRRHARSPSLTSNSDGMGSDNDPEDAALAEQCQNLRVSGDVEEVKKKEYLIKSEAMRWPTMVQAPQPSPPPGEHWTRYQDEDGGEYWYHYEGPLGQWWCGSDHQTIMPYVA